MSAFDVGMIAFAVLCGTGAVLSLLLPHLASRAVAVCGALGGALLVVLGGDALLAGAAHTSTLWTIPSIGVVVLHRDSLAGVFLLTTGIVVLAASIVAPIALASIAHRARSYAVMYFALLVSIVWILLAGDVFSFLVAWEIMSILCYLLVSAGRPEAETASAAYLMLAISEAGALAALLGLLVLATHAGGLGFAEIRTAAATLGGGARVWVFLLTFFGFGVKAGLVPVNGWLPRAYTAAPAAFAPVLAGATLNLGLYGMLRVNADLMPPASVSPGVVALIIGTLSALVGILYATTDNDLKTLLAHSSIENAGIITAGFGAGFIFMASDKPVLSAMAFIVALYHLVNHSVYKTLLFVGAGIVEQRAGTRDLDRLGGLIRGMPWTAAGVFVGVLSIAALPPLNGFVSEWLTLQMMLRSVELASVGVKVAFALCGAGLALTAALAVTCFAKFFAMGFLGMSRSPDAERARDPAGSGLASLAILAVCCVLLGVLPTYAIVGLDRAVRPMIGASAIDALVPPFFAGSAGHGALPSDFAGEFHNLGAQVGERVLPGPGLVIMHRGGVDNPVVWAGAPSYLAVVLVGLIGIVFVIVGVGVARRRGLVRRAAWDGGIRRLLPEMTYTATGFSNPVRVVFRAIFRPTVVEDTREAVAEHFRTAIRRESETVYVVERVILRPISRASFGIARGLAWMHHGRLNAYVAYVLGALLVVFGAAALLR